MEIIKEYQLLPLLAPDTLVSDETVGNGEQVTGFACYPRKAILLRAQWYSNYQWEAGLQLRI